MTVWTLLPLPWPPLPNLRPRFRRLALSWILRLRRVPLPCFALSFMYVRLIAYVDIRSVTSSSANAGMRSNALAVSRQRLRPL